MKAKHPSLRGTLRYLSPDPLCRAAFEVLDRNRDQEVFNGFAADDPAWTRHSTLRADLLGRTRDAWCRLAGKSFLLFPYSEDYVAHLYAKLSGAAPKRLAAWRREIAEGPGRTGP